MSQICQRGLELDRNSTDSRQPLDRSCTWLDRPCTFLAIGDRHWTGFEQRLYLVSNHCPTNQWEGVPPNPRLKPNESPCIAESTIKYSFLSAKRDASWERWSLWKGMSGDERWKGRSGSSKVSSEFPYSGTLWPTYHVICDVSCLRTPLETVYIGCPEL